MFSLQLIHSDTPAAKLANRVEILVNIVLSTVTPDVPNTLFGNMARACKRGRDFFYKNPALEPVYVLPPLRYLGVGNHIFAMEKELMNDRFKNLWEDLCYAFKQEGAERGRAWTTHTVRHEHIFRDVRINQCERFWDNPYDKNRTGLIIPRTFRSTWKTELEIYGTFLEIVGRMRVNKPCDTNIYRNRYEVKPTRVIAYCPCFDTRDYVAVWDDVEGPPRRIRRGELVEFVLTNARTIMGCRGAFV